MTRDNSRAFASDLLNTSRRDFLKAAAAGLAVTGFCGQPVRLSAEDNVSKTAETLVAQFYKSLTDQQKSMMAFDFDHPLRQDVDNNWHITKAILGDHFTPEQRSLVRDIFNGLHSEEYAETVMRQVEHDNRNTNRTGGFDGCSVAVFGTPGSGKFEFVFTGRHVTRRVDGDSVDGAAFGGPIFYGHAAGSFNEKPDHPGNAYWYQAKRANELFQALDGKQRRVALRTDAREENQKATVTLPTKESELHGLPVSEMSADQKQLAREVMLDVLAPFRKADVEESMKLIEASGFDRLHFAWYSNMDVGKDGVWDVWQIESPAVVWYFRGDPHVHTWVHIRQPA
ncbi:MAG: DUF3500 domain-containing protein [Planctomycetaceae bacterium]|nr:DUF3500 domain-containing protein [Planctomycetaceae bacterium]